MRPQFLGALAATAVVAAVLTGCSTHTPTTGPESTVKAQPTGAGGGAATEVINAVAVDSSGQPVNGYHEITSGQPIPDQADCTEPSPAAVSHAIYRCWPAAYGADVCWPASGLELLCMNDPWAKELHRIRAGAALPSVGPPAKPMPVGLALADGTHCRLRNGGAWGHRHDDLVGFYACAGAPGLSVLASSNADPIDRTIPVWTVKVGPNQAPDPSSPTPLTQQVRTVWFAGN
jgi:hypothetical protein